MDDPYVVAVTGIMGAGKTTVGRMIAERFERGVFIEADALQKMIVRGGLWVTDAGGPRAPSGEAGRQLRLRLRNACVLARSFQTAGFTPVVDDLIIGDRLDHLRGDLSGIPWRLVVLAPDVQTACRRDLERDKVTGAEWASYLGHELRSTMSGAGMWVDSSGQTPEETVDEIMRRLPREGLVES